MSAHGVACPARPCPAQLSPLCHPLGLGGRPRAAATTKVGYLPTQLLSFTDPPPAGCTAGSEWGGVEPPAQSSQVPVGCCPRLPFLLRVLSLLLFIQGFPTQCVEQYFRGRVGSQTDSRLHLGKLLGLSGLFFFFFLLICKIKQKSPTLQVVVMIKLWFSTLAVHQNSLGSPKMPMPGLHPD